MGLVRSNHQQHWPVCRLNFLDYSTRSVVTFDLPLHCSCIRSSDCWNSQGLKASRKCTLLQEKQTLRFFEGMYGLTQICWYLSLVLTTHINAQTQATTTSGFASSSLILCSMNLSLLYNPSLVKVRLGHKPYGDGWPKFSKAAEYYARGHAC